VGALASWGRVTSRIRNLAPTHFTTMEIFCFASIALALFFLLVQHFLIQPWLRKRSAQKAIQQKRQAYEDSCLFDTPRVFVHAHLPKASSILRRGFLTLKTGLVTTSGWEHMETSRERSEATIHGDHHQGYIYGALGRSPSDTGSNCYGKVVFLIRPEFLLQATATSGDSLDIIRCGVDPAHTQLDQLLQALGNKPDMGEVRLQGEPVDRWPTPEGQALIRLRRAVNPSPSIPYLEVQIPGPLPLDAIEAVWIYEDDRSIWGESAFQAALDSAQKAAIPVHFY
jgi:hypothetical protein